MFIAALVAGCANAPARVQLEPGDSLAGENTNVVAGSTGVIEESLIGYEPEIPGGCRKEVTTGTRIKRHTCEPAKDGRELLRLISQRGR